MGITALDPLQYNLLFERFFMARVRGYEMYPMPEKEQGKKSKEICEQGRKEIRRIGEELCKNISNKTGTLSENRDDILKRL